MLTVEGADVSYGGIRALHDVSISVGSGEFVGVLGRNGAGKTTLLNAVAGIVPMASGDVVFDGQTMNGVAAHRRARAGIALVQQNKRIFRTQSVLDNLVLGAYSSRTSRRELREDLAGIFEIFPVLAERRTQSAGLLSGGQQQMLAVGQALMARPRLLMLDEPSAGLAPVVVEDLFASLVSMERGDMSILLVEQLVHQTLQMCSRAYLLDTGSIVLSGRADELRDDGRIRDTYMANDAV